MDNTVNPQTAVNTAEIPAEVRTFLENMLTDAGMTFADESMKEDMIQELFTRLDSYITASIVDNLQPQDMDAFIKLNEEKRPKEEIETFLKDKIPDVQGMFAKTFADFRDLYVGNVDQARNDQASQEQAPTDGVQTGEAITTD